MATSRHITVVDIQNALLRTSTGNALRLEIAGMVKIDTLLANIPMDEWESTINANMDAIVETVANLMLRAAIINYAAEVAHRKATGTNPFTFSVCDAQWCKTEQMGQPMDEEDFAFSDPTIDYTNDCCPRIPFRRDGTLVGPLSEPRLEICLDCFYGARRSMVSSTIRLREQLANIIIYGAVGFLVPESIRAWLIKDETTYFAFTEESPVWELGLILATQVCDDYLIRLLRQLPPLE